MKKLLTLFILIGSLGNLMAKRENYLICSKKGGNVLATIAADNPDDANTSYRNSNLYKKNSKYCVVKPKSNNLSSCKAKDVTKELCAGGQNW